jgi:hypothetical protein
LHVVAVAPAEVVDCHAGVGDFFVGAVGVGEVELGGPVGGLVALDLAGCALRFSKGLEGGVDVDVWTALDVLHRWIGRRENILDAPEILCTWPETVPGLMTGSTRPV